MKNGLFPPEFLPKATPILSKPVEPAGPFPWRILLAFGFGAYCSAASGSRAANQYGFRGRSLRRRRCVCDLVFLDQGMERNTFTGGILGAHVIESEDHPFAFRYRFQCRHLSGFCRPCIYRDEFGDLVDSPGF